MKKQNKVILNAYIGPTGRLLPKTIRQRDGDCDDAFEKANVQCRYNPKQCKRVRVVVTW